MIDRENLLRCKLALYREILNATHTHDLSDNEVNIGYLLVKDAEVQLHIQKGLDNDKNKSKEV